METKGKIVGRIDGEMIEKLEECELSEEVIIGLLEAGELGVFAWKNRDILKADERFFCVKLDIDPSKTERADEIPERTNARGEIREFRDGEVLVVPYDETKLSNWVVDVWNSHGVLKPWKWGIEHGYKPENLPKGVRWIETGRFSVPARRELSEEEVKGIEDILGEFVSITQNGFYAVEVETLEKLKKLGVTAER